MYSHLAGKVALVTGSTSGIGLSVARELARNGVHVGLNGFGDSQKIQSIQKQIQNEFNVKTIFDGSDLRYPEQVKSLVKNVSSQLGPIQILVNNAGMQHIAPIEEFDDAKFNDIIAINLNSAFYAIKNSIPEMKRLDWGRIINIASVHGLVASVNKSAYVSSKHGIIGLTKAVGLELAKTNITCNAVCPGWVMTELIATQIQQRADHFKISFEEAKSKLLEEKTPSLKAASPEQIGEIVLFLCSQAAQEIRGSNINCDGGWVAQ